MHRTGANIEFTLYEATDKFMQVGAGIAYVASFNIMSQEFCSC